MNEQTPSTELEVRTEAPVARADVDGWIPVVGDYARLATQISETEFVPKALRGRTPAVAAALLYGREIGLAPMTTLTGTHVIEGKPAASAELMRALILGAGHEIRVLETTGVVCRMIGRRRGSEHGTEIVWTVDMARAAGVAGKDVWKRYPRQMLQARCTAELARLVFPDVIHGMRALEELDEVPTPAAETPVKRDTPTRPRRKRPPVSDPATSAPQTPDGSESPGMPLPGEDGYADDTPQGTPQEAAPAPLPDEEGWVDPSPPVPVAEAIEEALHDHGIPNPDEEEPEIHEAVIVEDGPAPETTAPPTPITRPQTRMLLARFAELGLVGEQLGGREKRIELCGRIVGREISSGSDLTKLEASGIIDTLSHVDSIPALEAILDQLDEEARNG